MIATVNLFVAIPSRTQRIARCSRYRNEVVLSVYWQKCSYIKAAHVRVHCSRIMVIYSHRIWIFWQRQFLKGKIQKKWISSRYLDDCGRHKRCRTNKFCEL